MKAGNFLFILSYQILSEPIEHITMQGSLSQNLDLRPSSNFMTKNGNI